MNLFCRDRRKRSFVFELRRQKGGIVIIIRERINLRQALLEELYDYHFETGRDSFTILDFNENVEGRLAYHYLNEKGYLDLFVDENGTNATIRAEGIELVEAGRVTLH